MKCEVEYEVIYNGGAKRSTPRHRAADCFVSSTESMRREWCALCDGLGRVPLYDVTVTCGRCLGFGFAWEPLR